MFGRDVGENSFNTTGYQSVFLENPDTSNGGWWIMWVSQLFRPTENRTGALVLTRWFLTQRDTAKHS